MKKWDELYVKLSRQIGRKQYSRFCCSRCFRHAEPFMLETPVWLSVCGGEDKAVLCFGCVEESLGRALKMEDFKAVPLNLPIVKGYLMGKSDKGG